MIVRELSRKHPEYVTIAHISDLHFTQDTRFPPDPGGAHLAQLIEDIKNFQPDILAVTGDFADNPFSNALKQLSLDLFSHEAGWDAWNRSLRDTFVRSRNFLEDLCRQCHIEPAIGLFVVPGNHDYRLQGTYSGILFKHLEEDTAPRRSNRRSLKCSPAAAVTRPSPSSAVMPPTR